MRFYRVVISDPTTNEIIIPNYNGSPGFTRLALDPTLDTYTSLYPYGLVTMFGSTNPAAQRIVMDLPTTFFHAPGQNSFIRMYGVGLVEIGQSWSLTNLNIEVYGGMAAGLPLANPDQAGLLVSGQIFQAFGNWIGTEMTLDIYLYYGGSSPSSAATTGSPNSSPTKTLPSAYDTPANIVFNWIPGQPMMLAIVNALSQAFPQYDIVGDINPNLIRNGAADVGYFSTLRQFADYINQKSISVLKGYQPSTIPTSNDYYQGVSITLQDGVFTIIDGTVTLAPKAIEFFDLIGQPTWSQPFTVQVTCVMRSDISVGDYVTLPPGLGTITSEAQSNYYSPGNTNTYAQSRQSSIFSGTFQVLAVRHVGDHRAEDATGWVSIFDLQQQVSSTGSTVVSDYPSQG
jgi:hypothetical protein